MLITQLIAAHTQQLDIMTIFMNISNFPNITSYSFVTFECTHKHTHTQYEYKIEFNTVITFIHTKRGERMIIMTAYIIIIIISIGDGRLRVCNTH